MSEHENEETREDEATSSDPDFRRPDAPHARGFSAMPSETVQLRNTGRKLQAMIRALSVPVLATFAVIAAGYAWHNSEMAAGKADVWNTATILLNEKEREINQLREDLVSLREERDRYLLELLNLRNDP